MAFSTPRVDDAGEVGLNMGNHPHLALSLSGSLLPCSGHPCCRSHRCVHKGRRPSCYPPLPCAQRPVPLPLGPLLRPSCHNLLPFHLFIPLPRLSPPPRHYGSVLPCSGQQMADSSLPGDPALACSCLQGSVYLFQLVLLDQLYELVELRDQSGLHSSVRQSLKKCDQLFRG